MMITKIHPQKAIGGAWSWHGSVQVFSLIACGVGNTHTTGFGIVILVFVLWHLAQLTKL